MADVPYAYAKEPQTPVGRLRVWLGGLLLIATLAGAVYLFFALRPRERPADGQALERNMPPAE